MSLFDQITNHDYLYLDKLVEENDLELVLWISEASSECSEGRNEENEIKSEIITPKKLCKKYKIIFDEYISYSVRNESFTTWNNYEVFTGNLFRLYSKSRFLDYVSVAVDSFIIEHTQENEIKYFGIICLNNIIDIATCNEPTIEEII